MEWEEEIFLFIIDPMERLTCQILLQTGVDHQAMCTNLIWVD